MKRQLKRTKRNHFNHLWYIMGAFTLIGGSVCLKVSWDSHSKNRLPPTESTASVSSLSTLLALPAEDLAHVNIARMNLLCAQGLPGAADLDVNSSLATLDQMAARVRSETEHNFHRFQSNPTEFGNSEGFFRMIMLTVVLTEDFKMSES